jgi:hypothetical protein
MKIARALVGVRANRPRGLIAQRNRDATTFAPHPSEFCSKSRPVG